MRPMPMTLALLSAFTLPTLAQTATHRATTTAHRPVTHTTAGRCSIALPAVPMKVPALPATAPKCPTGEIKLTWIDITVGTGELAKPRQYYSVKYTGWLPDGTKFDSSYDHPGGEPISFPYGAKRVITGWDVGFEGMHVGGKRRLFVPYELAYGEAGHPPTIPEKSMLVFDVELVKQTDPAVMQQEQQKMMEQMQKQQEEQRKAAPPTGTAPATPGSAQPAAGAATPNPATANPAANPTTDPTKPNATTPKP